MTSARGRLNPLAMCWATLSLIGKFCSGLSWGGLAVMCVAQNMAPAAVPRVELR
jgi:hypothetical protein